MKGATLCRPGGVAVVIVAAGLWLSACSGSSGLGAAGSFTPRTPDTLTVATAQIPEPGFWSGSAKRPTGGFEYELARALAQRLGLARVKVIEVPFAELTAGNLGGADLAISDITVTPERSEHVAFSTPYLSAPPAVVVHPGTEVADEHAARGLRWAVQSGTTLQSALEQSIDPSVAPQILKHEREVLLALRVGRAEAVLLDLPVALSYARESPSTYAVAAQLKSEAVLAAALPKGSENFEAVDSAIRALTTEGAIERLAEEWLHTNLEGDRAEEVPVLRTAE
jgi:polar amino acid transport system substrate-binding protein